MMKTEEKEEHKEGSKSEKPDVGIFAAAGAKSHDESSLAGFCVTYNKARSSPSRSIVNDGEEDENQFEEENEDADTTPIDQPVTKKQRTALVCKPSLLLDTYPDIFENVYSFLALKEAVVLRRVCHGLHKDTDIFRYSVVVDATTVSRTITNNVNAYRSWYLERQELAMCNLPASALRSLLKNKTLPESLITCFLKKLIEKSTKDNGEAVSVLLQDDRVRVEPNMLDLALRKDFTSMAAALQQDEGVRASIRMCSTCSIKIGAYECFRGLRCLQLARPSPGQTVPKFCRDCAKTNGLFCKCGEALCRKCESLVGVLIQFCDCGNLICGRGECVLRTCPDCRDQDKCSDCPCNNCHYTDNMYDEMYGDGHYELYGDGDSYNSY